MSTTQRKSTNWYETAKLALDCRAKKSYITVCLLNSHPSSFTGLSPGKLKLWFGLLYPGRGAVTVLTTRELMRAASVSGGATLGESRSARVLA